MAAEEVEVVMEREDSNSVELEKPGGIKRKLSDASLKNLRMSYKEPITVEWRDINFKMTMELGTPIIASKPFTNHILKNVSGKVRPGEMLAIMGPTGSGKTSLLNVLAHRVRKESGELLLNGEPSKKNLKRKIAYIMQQDIFIAVQTVREVLLDTARLRLPAELSLEEKKQVVADTIASMNLEKATNTIVGSLFPFRRGISGGEKKRLNIANELLTNPSLLLVDEPTSGLDSSTSFVVLSLLKALAQEGRTVITTIHQPSSQIFNLFDKLMLLADGNVVYNGPAATAVNYFEKLTDPCPSRYNPADYLLELLVERKDADGETPLKVRLIEEYKKHKEAAAAEEEADFVSRHHDGKTVMPVDNNEEAKDRKWQATWLEQFMVLGKRAMKFKYDRALSMISIVQNVAMILITMIVWMNMSYNEDTLRDRAGLLFYAIVWFNVMPMTGCVLAFCSDRQVLEKERAVGTYRLSSYLISRIVFENPVDFVLQGVFVIVVYWSSNLSDNVGSFFALWALLILMLVLGHVCGTACASAFLDLQQAMTVALVYFLFCMLIGGYYTTSLPSWIEWGKYISPVYFGYELSLIIIFWDGDLLFSRGQMDYWNRNQYPVNGKMVLKDFFHVDKNNFYIDIIALFAFLFGFMLMAYLALRFLNRPKI